MKLQRLDDSPPAGSPSYTNSVIWPGQQALPEANMWLQRRLVVILYADVAGFSLLADENEETTYRTLRKYQQIFAGTIDSHSGRVVNYAGDALLASFDSVKHALSCALIVQHELENRNEHLPTRQRMRFRIGINMGYVIVDRIAIFGNAVNLAARLESLAEPGGICISESVRKAADNSWPLSYHDLGNKQVKNIFRPIRAFHLHTKAVALP